MKDKVTNMPKIALGAWSWGVGSAGGDQVFGNSLDADDLRPVYRAALEHGLYLWDTAAVYGDGSSERILGQLIAELGGDRVVLSTKFTPQIADGTPAAVQHMLDGSKERLGVDVIDLYWIHNPMDVERWTPDLIPLVETGQVRSVGVSNHNLDEIKRAQEILGSAGIRLSAVQNHYSLLHRSSERAGILDYCREQGIDFYAYMVLEQGALTGKYGVEHPFAEGSERAASYNRVLPQIEALTDHLARIGATHGASAAQVATAWAIAKGARPIVGVTSAKQVEQAASASSIGLSESELSELERLGDEAGVHTLRSWERDMD